jgi:ribosomal protein L11 methyltransferase
MSWIQVSVFAPAQASTTVEDLLTSLGALSVTLSDAADDPESNPVLEPAPGATPLWQQSRVTGLFDDSYSPETLKQQIVKSLPDEGMVINTELLDDQDWTRAWMASFQPMKFGSRLWVCPWHLEPPEPAAVNLRLDPGLAFGTGTHPTTSLCLRWLDAFCQHRRVLDYGCGSGILAIAALLLGAESADCVDIDDQALQATRENAKANLVEQHLHTCKPEQLANRQYDLVIANILSGPLTELAPVLAGYTASGGDIVLSGILSNQADDVRAAYARDFDMYTTQIEGDWVLLHGRRRG